LKKIEADSFIRMCCEVSIPTYENKKKCFNKFFDMKDLSGLGPEQLKEVFTCFNQVSQRKYLEDLDAEFFEKIKNIFET
jgi:hypothetical protein